MSTTKASSPTAMLGASLAVLALAMTAYAQDWPIWGRDHSRNMIGQGKNLPIEIGAGSYKEGSDEIDLAQTKNVRWVAKLGSESYGNAVVADGRVYVGTNNSSPRNKKYSGDRAVVYCLNEKTGELIWEFSSPKLGTGKVSDWEFLGICSSPAIDGKRIYLTTNRCQVVCLDVEGLVNGNDGDFKDEAKYFADNDAPPIELDKKDADVIWVYDLREELGVFPHNITSSSILVVGDRLYVNTSNGVDWSHVNIPNPRAPVLICLDKKTGALLAEETLGMSTRILHGNWSSPAYGMVGGVPTIVFAGGDGFCYGFNPEPKKDAEGTMILEELWRVDGNPPNYRIGEDGKPLKYATPKGPSEFIATPVIHEGKVYVAIGQDPEHGEGIGNLMCIDPQTKRGDITKTGVSWRYDGIARSISTVSIAEGILYVGDYSGFIHAVDPSNGKPHWVHDTKGHIWASTLLVDGKLYLGNADGYLTILAAGKTKKVLAEIEFPAPIFSSAIVANDSLYIATQTHLYAIARQP